LPTIKQALAKKGLQQDLLPNGYPEYQPVEQAFNFVASYVKKKANTYAPLGTWQEADLCNVIKRRSVRSITRWLKAGSSSAFAKCILIEPFPCI
jgi:hypothetical protein